MKQHKTLKNLLGLVGFFLTLFGFTACSSDSSSPDEEKQLPPTERKEISLNQQATKAAEELQPFYINYTKDAIKYVDGNPNIKDKNVVVSPLSASFLLGMLANGLESSQAAILADYLGCDNLSALNDLSLALMESLPEIDNQSKLMLANAIWVNNEVALSSSVSSILENTYKAEISYEDFNNTKALFDKINGWGSKKTDGMIPSSIKEINANSVAVLLNTILFKSKWAEENMFPKQNTSTAPFFGQNGRKNVSMMKSVEDSGEVSMTDNFTACGISFGNGQFNLFLIVPNEGMSLLDAERLLTGEEINALRKASYPCRLTISLPKFKVEGYVSVNDILKNGGIDVLDNINVLRMFEPEIAGVTTSNQSASFEVDERGVKVAAATDGDISFIAPPLPDDKFELTFNRPFYFFITEYSTQACILSGRITDL
ncbi:MAG: hypothetical protein K2G90_09455 [Muribaculaceae bacterium]|nr:hypothetical protein [Muribaculaceae bacterium]